MEEMLRYKWTTGPSMSTFLQVRSTLYAVNSSRLSGGLFIWNHWTPPIGVNWGYQHVAKTARGPVKKPKACMYCVLLYRMSQILFQALPAWEMNREMCHALWFQKWTSWRNQVGFVPICSSLLKMSRHLGWWHKSRIRAFFFVPYSRCLVMDKIILSFFFFFFLRGISHSIDWRGRHPRSSWGQKKLGWKIEYNQRQNSVEVE